MRMRRLIAFALWAYFGWYLTTMLAAAAGLPPEIGPLGGAAIGVFALIDWRGRMRSSDRGLVVAPGSERQRTS
jgi:hypothetical protein